MRPREVRERELYETAHLHEMIETKLVGEFDSLNGRAQLDSRLLINECVQNTSLHRRPAIHQKSLGLQAQGKR